MVAKELFDSIAYSQRALASCNTGNPLSARRSAERDLTSGTSRKSLLHTCGVGNVTREQQLPQDSNDQEAEGEANHEEEGGEGNNDGVEGGGANSGRLTRSGAAGSNAAATVEATAGGSERP